MTYSAVKTLHLIAIALSITGFCVRGYWMMAQSAYLQHRVVRIAPHVIDTVLLLSGVSLILMSRLNPFEQPWLLAKFAGLAAYIVLGGVALKRGRTLRIRIVAFLLALLAFACIIGAALLKTAGSWQ